MSVTSLIATGELDLLTAAVSCHTLNRIDQSSTYATTTMPSENSRSFDDRPRVTP
jgi:hypothetical protein